MTTTLKNLAIFQCVPAVAGCGGMNPPTPAIFLVHTEGTSGADA
jgi:hypothetical protein